MNRRSFLKGLGATAGAIALGVAVRLDPVTVERTREAVALAVPPDVIAAVREELVRQVALSMDLAAIGFEPGEVREILLRPGAATGVVELRPKTFKAEINLSREEPS